MIPDAADLAIDLFAGPGGWDLAAQRLGLATIGIEFDKQACQTRRAAGLVTIEGDVRDYGPGDFPTAKGLIASPPCQTFSLAGKGAGRSALDLVLKCIEDMYWGNELPEDAFADDRTALVLEPLRWALEAWTLGHPYEWLAFEQVPTVLPVWVGVANVLRRIGYDVVVGNVQAEQYGVPQTRKRAILMARHRSIAGSRLVALPTPTHSKYHSRNPTKLDEGVEKWVSMAEALGWGMTKRPYPTIACSRSTGGPDKEKVGGTKARAIIYDERASGKWVQGPADQDILGEGQEWVFCPTNDRGRATLRLPSEPAPTLAFGHEKPHWVLYDHSNPSRPVEEQPDEDSWAFDRPSTTLVGSFRPEVIAAPGWRKAGDGPRQNAKGSIKVTEEEAAVLQSFPADYPWQGGKGKKFQQIGNAIPPLLAAAILREVTK